MCVNDRSDAVSLAKMYPNCTNVDVTLQPHATIAVECGVAIGHTTGVQVRMPGNPNAGSICYPYLFAISTTSVHLDDVGNHNGVYCRIETESPTSYRVVLTPVGPALTIAVRNDGNAEVMSYAHDPHCAPQGYIKLGHGASTTYECDAEGLTGRNGILFAEMSPSYVYVCQPLLSGDALSATRGNGSCSIAKTAARAYSITIH